MGCTASTPQGQSGYQRLYYCSVLISLQCLLFIKAVTASSALERCDVMGSGAVPPTVGVASLEPAAALVSLAWLCSSRLWVRCYVLWARHSPRPCGAVGSGVLVARTRPGLALQLRGPPGVLGEDGKRDLFLPRNESKSFWCGLSAEGSLENT